MSIDHAKEVTHIAQHLAAIDLATDLEWVAEEWEEFEQRPYLSEANKLITVFDALTNYRASRTPKPVAYGIHLWHSAQGRAVYVSDDAGRPFASLEEAREFIASEGGPMEGACMEFVELIPVVGEAAR